ncbi:hypothetical protein AAHA92_28708 [Salvia divinorum]|uniref:Uncharacterized protein n=1 Tax=Salvia divinorum TaxID=28513 RepID=A0ABD1FVY6_SALDI
MESLSLDEFEYYVCYGYERPLPKFSSVKEMKDYTTRVLKLAICLLDERLKIDRKKNYNAILSKYIVMYTKTIRHFISIIKDLCSNYDTMNCGALEKQMEQLKKGGVDIMNLSSKIGGPVIFTVAFPLLERFGDKNLLNLYRINRTIKMSRRVSAFVHQLLSDTSQEERKIMEDKIREEEREEDGKKRDKTLEDGAAKKDREGAAKKDKAVEAFTRAKRAFEEKGFSIAHKAFTEVSLCRFLPWRGHPYLETDH